MNIDDWKISGAGMEGESYISESHPELMMKVYTIDRPASLVEEEFRQAQLLAQMGINTPKVYNLTQWNGRPAIIFQKITNKKSFCSLAGEHPEMIPSLARRMADSIKELHSKSAVGTPFRSYIENIRAILESTTVYDDEAKSRIRKALDEISKDERHTLVHGDMHYGNIITDGQQDYLIDLGDISYGHPNNDIAMFYIVTHYTPGPASEFLFHISLSQAMVFWNEFKLCYYGREISDQEILDDLKNYLLARAVWFKLEGLQKAYYSFLSQENIPLQQGVEAQE